MLRTVVALVNMCAGGFLVWVSLTSYSFDAMVAGYALLLGVNAVLLLHASRSAASRPARLLSLWLDAKEAELRRRAGQSTPEGGVA